MDTRLRGYHRGDNGFRETLDTLHLSDSSRAGGNPWTNICHQDKVRILSLDTRLRGYLRIRGVSARDRGLDVPQIPSQHHGMGQSFWVYLLASQKRGTPYCGHTDNLAARVFAHREGRGASFTRKYGVTRLVWAEPHETREAAKTREYQIKKWNRAWKIELIEEVNPDWDDLYLKLNQ